MKKMTQTLAKAILALLFIGVTASLAEEGKVAIVDMQKVISESRAGKKARDIIEAQVKKGEEGLQKKKNEIDKLRKDLETQKGALSASAMDEKANSIDKKAKELERVVQDLREDLGKKNREEIAKIVRGIQGVIKDIAEKKGISVVMERGPGAGVIWASPDADISDEVLSAFDKK